MAAVKQPTTRMALRLRRWRNCCASLAQQFGHSTALTAVESKARVVPRTSWRSQLPCRPYGGGQAYTHSMDGWERAQRLLCIPCRVTGSMASYHQNIVSFGEFS